MNSEEAFKDLKEVKQVLDSLNVRWFLSYGAVLGIVRQKDFIPYDDDIDITIVEPLTFKQRKEISWKLQDLGFVPQDEVIFNVQGRFEKPVTGWLGKDVCAYSGDEKTGIIVAKKRVNWSIFFFKEEGDEYIFIPMPGSCPILSTPKRFYEKGEWLKFKGEKYLVPSPVKEYLTYTYGDWKTPKENAHAPQYLTQHDQKEIFKKYFNE